MEQRRLKYHSLFLAVLLHALLFMLCYYFSLQRKPINLPLPAKVTVEQPTQTSHSTQPTYEQPIPEPASLGPVSPGPVPLEPALPEPASLESASLESASLEPVPLEPAEKIPVQLKTTESLVRPKEATQKDTSKISGAAFMNAFKESVRTEKENISKAMPGHVFERVIDWQTADFRQKITRALIKACHIHRKYVQTYTPIKNVFNVTIVIDKSGRIIKLPKKITGAPEIDSYLEEFFKTADFPPIPQRMNLQEYPINVTIHLSLKEGRCNLQLRPSFED